jgi:phosphatidylinositol alpha-1,6-mannosyltransferase
MKTRDDLRIFLLTELFLPHAGGSRYYYYNLFKRLADMQCDVTVLTKKVPGWEEFDSREKSSAFHLRRRFQPQPLRYSQLIKTLAPIADTAAFSLLHPPDVVHCGDLFPPGAVGILLKKMTGIPFIAYSHGEDITLVDSLRFQPKMRDFIYRAADAVIANSEFAVRQLARIGVRSEKVHKVTPGLDASVFRPMPPPADLRQRYGVTDEIVLLTVGRLVPRKGHSLVLRALSELSSELPGIKYVIVGRGPEENVLIKQASDLNLRDKVVFAGFIPDEELNLHYNLADIFVMPNRDVAGDIEGFGMVFLEANAAGKPVVAGRSGGAVEAVVHGETGLLVDPEDARELRDALHALIADRELRQQLGATGLDRVRSQFDWDSRAAKVREISAEVARCRRTSRFQTEP